MEEDTPKDQIQLFAKEQYGEYGGYAQQYLFCLEEKTMLERRNNWQKI